MTDRSESGRRAHQEDELLVIRCQLGERPAFDELVERWHGPVWKYVRRVAGADDTAWDVAQDVWLRVLRGIGRLRDGTRLRPWLFGIARRALMDRLRHQYATPIDADGDLAVLAADVCSDDLEQELEAMERQLARLPIIERDVLTLAAGSEFSAGAPQLMFQNGGLVGEPQASSVGFAYDVAPDGNRFLIGIPTSNLAPPTPTVVMLNWTFPAR